MADIFISYAREDRARARAFADAFQSQGWTVWWDTHLQYGRDFGESIQKELNAAACVVVLWSNASVKSSYVLEEAQEGAKNGRLVPAFIARVDPPLGFRRLQAADVCDWTGSGPHEEFDRLIESIGALVGRSTHDTTTQPARPARPREPRGPLGGVASRRTNAAVATLGVLLLSIGAAYFLSRDDSGPPSGATGGAGEVVVPQPVSTAPPPPDEPSGPSSNPPTSKPAAAPIRPAVETPAPVPPARGATPSPAVSSVGNGPAGCGELEDRVRRQPELHNAHYELARCYYGASRYDEAIAAVGRAIDVNSRLPEYFRLRGVAKWRNGLARQGLADLDSAIQLDVMNPASYMARGEIHVATSDFQRAVDDFRKATDLAPSDAGAWGLLGNALMKNGDTEAAEVALRRSKSSQ